MLNLAAWVVVVASAAKGCHFYFAHRVTFLSCADILCRRPIKMSLLCQLQMTLPEGFPGVLGVTVRLMSDGELRRIDDSRYGVNDAALEDAVRLGHWREAQPLRCDRA